MPELINILIRTSNRPKLFRRCLKSIIDQSYPNIRIIVSIDNDCDYVPIQLETIHVTANRQLPYYYDEYCNPLKDLVTDGWFFFLDDDDFLMPDVLSKITLDSPAILHQLQRGNIIAPTSTVYQRGQIGMPCLMLHHSYKNIADIQGTGQGDYFWIKSVQDQIGCIFKPIILVGSDRRSLGK